MAITQYKFHIIIGVVSSLMLMLQIITTVYAEKEIPMTKLGQPNYDKVGHSTINFLYCYSCGYTKAFEEYANLIVQRYPGMAVHGGNYSPSTFNLYVSRCISSIKIIFITLIVLSYDFSNFFGIRTPRWYSFCLENKLFACMMIYFIGNVWEAELKSTGAFEISLNDMPVWSKLQTGRIPAPQELFQIIDSHMQFDSKLIDNGDFIRN